MSTRAEIIQRYNSTNFHTNLIKIAIGYSYNAELEMDDWYTWVALDPFGAGEDGFSQEVEMFDNDSYRNLKGRLRRPNVSNVTATTAQLNTRYLFENEQRELCKYLYMAMSLDDGFCSVRKRNVVIKYFNPNKNKYEIAKVYTPAPQWSTAGTWDVPRWNPTTIKFIDYGSVKTWDNDDVSA